jgi:FkbM family methyltransferase
MIKLKLINIYSRLFGRKLFFKFNHFIYSCSLRGLGVFNYYDEKISSESELNFLKKYLCSIKNPVVFDVGANIGNYSKKILQVNANAIIHVFEPHPTTFKKLTENINKTSCFSNNVGVGHEKGSLELFDYLDEDGSSHASLYKNVIQEIHKKEAISHLVPIITLSDYIKTNNILTIDLLKIDTEGNEFNVLKGLGNECKPKAIQFEFNEMNIISKVSFKDFWDLLPDYSFFRILPNGELLRIENYIAADCEIYTYQNIVAKLK